MQKLLLILISTIFLSGCTITNLFVRKPAGLEISTSSPAQVYLGDKNLGTSPLTNHNITPGTYTLRLIPDDSTLTPYEATVALESAASTVINRTFGETLLDSYGYSLSLIPDKASVATLSIVSDPDTSSLTLDGVPSGFTPLNKRELSPGSHELIVSTPGYQEQKIAVTLTSGFNLVVNLKLKAEPITLTLPETASSSSSPSDGLFTTSVPSPPPSATPDKPYVTVTNSPDVISAGGLNVRKEPSSTSDSLGKADVAEQLKYLGETTSAGWHKIEFEGSVGYVSAKYATLTR